MGLLHQLYSLFCSAGARSLVGAFPCQCCFLVCGGRVFGNHLLWALAAACAGPAGAGGVCVLRGSIPGGQAGDSSVSHSSCVPSPERGQGLAFVWLWGPCTGGCARLAGEVGCEQSWVMTGPSNPAWAGPLCCSQAPAADGWGGFGLGEASGATAGACGGCPR